MAELFSDPKGRSSECRATQLIHSLDDAGIESRPVWKPMHLQRLFAGCECFGGEVAADLFERGICLPSSSSLSTEDQDYVIDRVRAASLMGVAVV